MQNHFGVRGVGSIFYLAYAGGEATELASDWLWSTVSFTIVLSVFVHGALAAPVMRRGGASSARTTSVGASSTGA